uniref:PrsW family intramembrane metalloprotease n=1 Tax=Chromera velia CCMP2878 TaxID=1169474 RepID=A0A0G4GX27_9ALVE|eukprot:Cvel_5335.t1-p1 / transcript=Cvel_5335.t1 / gene=Cvel_5335 / organism=Chromera_velia_CCMP2878 / gene_product=Protease PrsW, putative / transcript_product=Protease PrsW, putative / location=Cvel_scaffold247:48718-50064(-) / protein_length=449 / sequence_SO=supercontig / SO=protein_coding / is_pseudo=false
MTRDVEEGDNIRSLGEEEPPAYEEESGGRETGKETLRKSGSILPVSCRCVWRNLLVFALYALMIAVFVVFAILMFRTNDRGVFAFSLFLLAAGPAVFYVILFVCRFRRSLFLIQIVHCITETVIYMAGLIPLVIGIDELLKLAFGPERRNVFGPVGVLLLHSFFMSFFRAGFLEETLKYLVARRLLWKDHVVDPRALLVYGLSAGASFAVFENLMYVFLASGGEQAGLWTGLARSIVSIPVHCVCGMIMGSRLGHQKFLLTRGGFLRIIWVPTVLHGTFNFSIYILGGMDEAVGEKWSDGVTSGTIFGTLLVVLGVGAVVARFDVVKLERFPQSDVPELFKEGLVSAPDHMLEGICPRQHAKDAFCCAPRWCCDCRGAEAREVWPLKPDVWDEGVLPLLEKGDVRAALRKLNGETVQTPNAWNGREGDRQRAPGEATTSRQMGRNPTYT